MARSNGEHLKAEHGLRMPWSRTERPVPRRVVKPLQSFLEQEAPGDAFLLAATVVALAWANSPWRDSYEQLWGTNLTIGVGRWAILFIVDLALAGGPLADTTKVGVLAASLVAGAIGYAVLRRAGDAGAVRR